MPTFLEIYELYGSMVYNLCLNYLQNQQDAEEAAQDVFVKVYQRLAQYRGDASLKTWVYRITINQCLDVLKSRKRRSRFGFVSSLFGLVSELSEYHPPVFDHPGVLLEDQEALQQLFTKINSLPEQQKTAILLRYMEDLSPPAVAEIMGLSLKAVESLLQRGKQNLEKKLTDTEGSK